VLLHNYSAAVAISAMELIFWITLVYGNVRLARSSILTVCDNAGRIKERAWCEKGVFVLQEYCSLSEWTVQKCMMWLCYMFTAS